MNSCNDMVTYDQWSYVTIPVILEEAFVALHEGIPIDRLLFGGSCYEYATATGQLVATGVGPR